MGNQTLKGLADLCNARADALDDVGNRIAINAALVVLSSLTEDTPVDESTAISNWQVALNYPVQSKIEAYYTGERGSTRLVSVEATMDAGRKVLANKRPGEPIIISNVLPYIRRLNDGYSNQHPGAFVAAAVIRGREYVKGLAE